MQLNASEISSLIKDRIAGFDVQLSLEVKERSLASLMVSHEFTVFQT